MSNTDAKPGCDCACMGTGPAVTQFLRTLGPSDQVSQHFKNAQLEVMMGFRAFLDEQIAARGAASSASSTSQGTRITVE